MEPFVVVVKIKDHMAKMTPTFSFKIVLGVIMTITKF